MYIRASSAHGLDNSQFRHYRNSPFRYLRNSLRDFSYTGNSSSQLQAQYCLNTRLPDLECQKLSNLASILHHHLRISLTFRFCQLQVKYKSSFISTFSEYAYESTGLWNWERCLGRLHHWHCERQVPERRTSISPKTLVKLTPGHIPDNSAWYVTHGDRYQLGHAMACCAVCAAHLGWNWSGGQGAAETTDQISVSTSYFSICVSWWQQVVFALIEQSLSIYLDELQEELSWCYHVNVSIATIWKTLHCLGLSSKQVSISFCSSTQETEFLISFRRLPLSVVQRPERPSSFASQVKLLRVWCLQMSVGSI